MKVSVVIPNWNGERFLGACLKSLVAQSYKDFDIILVDNFSEDESLNIFEHEMSETNVQHRIIKLDKNYGFSRAVNEGIKSSSAEYVFLLNNDTELHADCIKSLIAFMEDKKNVFSASAKMLKFYERDILDDAGDMYTVMGWAYQRGHNKKASKYEKDAEVFSSCAGAAMYRRSIFNEIGYFDENHFAYLEDVDIGYRAKLYGYKNYFCASALVYHIGSGSSGGKYNDFKVKISARNSIYLIYKNMTRIQVLINSPFLLAGILIKWIFFTIKSGKYGKLYAEGIKEGILDCYKGRLLKAKMKTFLSPLIIEKEIIFNLIKYSLNKLIN